MTMIDRPAGGRARPVIALMGEFSAGKSTLANLLLGERASPVKVTATQLPPIWYTYGTGSPERVDLEGHAHPIPPAEIEGIDPHDTAFIRVPLAAGVLELMDLIDMPGISDPNMEATVWKRLIHEADGVIWCTHATQAWRQSEAATWEELPAELHANSLLLLTRADKLREADLQRVVTRVKAETGGMFAGLFPVSLMLAATAGEDRDAWEVSGAEAVTRSLLDIVFRIDNAARRRPTPIVAHAHANAGDGAPRRPASAAAPAPSRPVVPRRVQARGDGGSRTRLPHSAIRQMVPGHMTYGS
ncbi:GTPase [Rhodovulum sp. 12E13]|uniref:GTPase n=1 Tax=Rhodovulum sp. 12E13 TaxID=2203891 RepID=UPI001314261E|nr:GTPase [Rhodovulum sp. 12E13]